MQLGNRFNNLIGPTGLFALALSATLAVAESNETISIKVKTDDGLSEAVTIENLAVGQTDVFVTDSGREVLVTRSEDALDLEIDGRNIQVALPHVERFGSGDHHGDALFITKDESVVVSEGMSKRILIKGEGPHCADDGDGEHCAMVKRLHFDGEMDGEWVDEDGAHTIIIKKALGDDVEVIDINEVLSEVEIDGVAGDHEVIVIEREVEIHSEEDH